MIDRYHLRYFLAVVDAGNFSRAAGQMNVTQPTLSVGIAKLEESLKARLFLRNSRRVQLTQAGARLLHHARAIESEFNSLDLHLFDQPESRTLRIGVLSTISTRLIETVVRANATAAAPDTLEIIEGGERDLLGRLQRRRIDVALTLIRPGASRFAQEVLFQEGYSLAAAADHPCARMEIVTGESLAGETMIVRRHCEVLSETSRYFTERGVRPHFSFRTTNDDRATALVKAGLGVTVMPDSHAEPGLAMPKLAGFDVQRQVGLIWSGAEPDHASAAVLALRALTDQRRH
jgi:DNA-binding transcriptional LysR family regulator